MEEQALAAAGGARGNKASVVKKINEETHP